MLKILERRESKYVLTSYKNVMNIGQSKKSKLVRENKYLGSKKVTSPIGGEARNSSCLNVCNLMKWRFKRFMNSWNRNRFITSLDVDEGNNFHRSSNIDVRSLVRSWIRANEFEFIGAFIKHSVDLRSCKLSCHDARSPNKLFIYILCSKFVQLIISGENKEAILFAKEKLFPILNMVPNFFTDSIISDLDVTPIFELTKIIESDKSIFAKLYPNIFDIRAHHNQEERGLTAKSLTDVDACAEENFSSRKDYYDSFNIDFNSYGSLFLLPSAIVKKSHTILTLPDFIQVCLTLLVRWDQQMEEKCPEEKNGPFLAQISDLLNTFLCNLSNCEDLACLNHDTKMKDIRQIIQNHIDLKGTDAISLCISRFLWLKYIDFFLLSDTLN